ncbi:MAG: PTS sugar transporter subunit IIA [Candidatus Omnitrophota bacterium]
MGNEKVMTTRELANYMKLSEKTILKKAQNGELPGVRVGSQWRFNLAAIDKYLQEDIMHDMPKDELNIIIETAQNIIPLSRLISPGLMNLNLKAKTKDEVLSEIAETAYKGGIISAKKTLLNQLQKREKMLSTAVGNGIAIPHPRNPNPTLFKKPNILMAKSVEGIDFQAPDNKKVYLFFMICAPNMIVHLRLLAKISRLLHVGGVVDKFINISNSDEMIKVFLAIERNQLFPWEVVE